MARFLYWTDLHTEYAPFSLPDVDGMDAVLLGGDTCNAKILTKFCTHIHQHYKVPVITILGNHEGYGEIWNRMCARLEQEFQDARMLGRDIHLLNPGIITIKDTRIVGATLWSDLAINPNPMAEFHIQKSIKDYSLIKIEDQNGERTLLPDDTKAWHKAEKAFIFDALNTPHDGPTLVLTHHQPSAQSVHPRLRGDVYNGAYASMMDDDISQTSADVWLYGHGHLVETYDHDRIDGKICRMRSNCRGYPWQTNPEIFDPRLIIET